MLKNCLCIEELSQEASCSSQAPDKKISQEASCSSQGPDGEISSDGPFNPPLALCFPRLKWVLVRWPLLVRGNVNLVGSRISLVTFGYKLPLIVTLYVTVERKTFNLFSFFKSNRCEFLSPPVKKSKLKHFPFKV